MLISVSAVAAADNSTQIINTKNSNDNFLTVDNKEKLTDESYGSFADLNKTINGNSSTNIVLDRDYTYSSSDRIKEGIVINKDNITIDGQGHTIDAKNQSRIFYVNSTTVYLKNIVFTNGYSASNGGAIFSDGNNLRIINCTFISNAAEFGGAVYSYPDNLDVFQNSNFVANKADCGGAVYLMYGIRHYVFNCTFESNQATDYGGAIAIYGIQGHTERPYSDSLTVDGSKFLYNKAKYGDAISNPHSACLNITNSVLLGNVENLIDNDVYFAYANYNWFGNTYNNKSVRPNLHKSIGLDNWLYFDLIPNLDTSRATISINNLYNAKTGETGIYSTSKLPLMNVDVNTTNATINSNNITLDNAGQYELEFVLLGNSVLIANCENIEVSKNIEIGGLRELENLIKNTPDNSVITLDKDYVYYPIFTYKWVYNPNSLSRSYFSKKDFYIDTYLGDFMMGACYPFFDMYLNDKREDKKAFALNQIMMTLLHGYFYYQSSLWRLGSNDTLVESYNAVKDLKRKIVKELKMTDFDITNYIYQIPDRYNSVKRGSQQGCCSFVEVQSFRDFILNL